jgi:SAM-dependent methyltransferase
METALSERQRIEKEFWRDSPTERPESDALENIVGKMADAEVFLDLVERYRPLFARAGSVLELGGGQGWASCAVKRLVPAARVVATDISPYAVASVRKWEQVYGVRLDGTRHCPSYETGEPPASVDLVFCFAAAHHFAAHRRTVAEVARLLRPGGHCLYLYEPSCRPALHAAAKRRVNRKRPHVPEDVLVYPKLVALARAGGLLAELDFYPSVRRRGPKETLYYWALQQSAALQRLLPCTVNYHFTKPA